MSHVFHLGVSTFYLFSFHTCVLNHAHLLNPVHLDALSLGHVQRGGERPGLLQGELVPHRHEDLGRPGQLGVLHHMVVHVVQGRAGLHSGDGGWQVEGVPPLQLAVGAVPVHQGHLQLQLVAAAGPREVVVVRAGRRLVQTVLGVEEGLQVVDDVLGPVPGGVHGAGAVGYGGRVPLIHA